MKRVFMLFFYFTLVRSVAFDCVREDCISCTIAKLNQDYGEAVESHCENVLNCCMIEQADEMARIMQKIKYYQQKKLSKEMLADLQSKIGSKSHKEENYSETIDEKGDGTKEIREIKSEL